MRRYLGLYNMAEPTTMSDHSVSSSLLACLQLVTVYVLVCGDLM